MALIIAGAGVAAAVVGARRAKKKYDASDFKHVAEAMAKSSPHLRAWAPQDLTLGLYYLGMEKDKNRAALPATPPPGTAQTRDPIFIAQSRRYLAYANACYFSNAEEFCNSEAGGVRVPHSDVLDAAWKGDTLRPAYVLSRDTGLRVVILSVRGTFSISDVLTDAAAAPMEFEGSYAHMGMARAAAWIVEQLGPKIDAALKANPGYKLALTGHSLGAGTAALACVLLHKKYSHAQAWCYATPACMSAELSAKCAGYVRSIIMREDLVPRFSLHSAEMLRLEILAFNWSSLLKADIADSAAVKRLSEVTAAAKAKVPAWVTERLEKARGQAVSFLKEHDVQGKALSAKMKGKKAIEKAKEWAHVDEKQLASEAAEEERRRSLMPLCPAGRIYHIQPNASETFWLLEVAPETFGQIVLSRDCIFDHLLTSYQSGLDQALDALPKSKCCTCCVLL